MTKRTLAATLAVLALPAAPAVGHLTRHQQSLARQHLWKSRTVVAWHNGAGRWTLFPTRPGCRGLAAAPARLCAEHRALLRAHAARVDRLRKLLAPRPAGRRVRVLVTSYCLRGTTASGTAVHWGAVAVDPALIPMGSRLYVPGYGPARAEDTGGAIVGAHIDEWRPSCSDALRATRRETITVYG